MEGARCPRGLGLVGLKCAGCEVDRGDGIVLVVGIYPQRFDRTGDSDCITPLDKQQAVCMPDIKLSGHPLLEFHEKSLTKAIGRKDRYTLRYHWKELLFRALLLGSLGLVLMP